MLVPVYDGLRAPFPWWGGKSRVAAVVWERFGDVTNYVEPFAGSLAVLLGRPHAPRIETVNDLDYYLANFLRALQADPAGLAAWADDRVDECNLHARHRWLLDQADFRVRMVADPDYYDVKIAGWWVWGICQWIGSGWCSADCYIGRPSQKLPHLGNGRGVQRVGLARENGVLNYFEALATRLRRVRVCCGDWTRVLGPTPTEYLGITGILLDPPYSHDERKPDLYGVESDVADAVRAWAIANGDNPRLRLALCGYDGEHKMPEGWVKVRWKAQGGYGCQGNGRGRENSMRECVWFSPHCLHPGDLFTLAGVAVEGR